MFDMEGKENFIVTMPHVYSAVLRLLPYPMKQMDVDITCSHSVCTIDTKSYRSLFCSDPQAIE